MMDRCVFFRHIQWTRIRRLSKILPVISKFREKYYFCKPTLWNLAVVAQYAVNWENRSRQTGQIIMVVIRFGGMEWN